MNFKPGDFFLGIVDFLGVLVPGAVLVYLEDEPLARIFGTSPVHANWLVFAVAAYFLGHLLLASTEILHRLGKRLEHKIWFIRGTQYGVDKLEEESLPLLGKAAAGSTGFAFHAALSFLRLRNADAAAEIDRHMAGYKLLRNLVAVFSIDLVFTLFGWHKTWRRLGADFLLAVLFFLAFLRMLQWSNLLAFQYCILIRDQKLDPQKPTPSTLSTTPQ